MASDARLVTERTVCGSTTWKGDLYIVSRTAVIIIVVLLGVIAAGFIVQKLTSQGTPVAQTQLVVPSTNEKISMIRGYYADITSGNFEGAYDRLTNHGSFESADALKAWYCAVSQIGPTDLSDVPNSATMNVTIVGHSQSGDATTYTGTVTYSRDSGTGKWSLDRPNLARGGTDPKLVGKSCVPPATPSSPVAEAVELTNPPNGLTYQFVGDGRADLIQISFQNETDHTWSVKIKQGMRLEPDDSSVQSMVVTEDVDVEIEPHEETKPLQIRVACLDISLDAPQPQDTSWRLSESAALVKFIDCTGYSRTTDAHNLQLAIWFARGATHDDFVNLITKYGKDPTTGAVPTEQEVGNTINLLEEQVQPVAEKCGPLSTL
jgi:hypothetical protein